MDKPIPKEAHVDYHFDKRTPHLIDIWATSNDAIAIVQTFAEFGHLHPPLPPMNNYMLQVDPTYDPIAVMTYVKSALSIED